MQRGQIPHIGIERPERSAELGPADDLDLGAGGSGHEIRPRSRVLLLLESPR